MKKELMFLVVIVFFIAMNVFSQKNNSPKPFGHIPSQRQLKWQELERYAFIHFTINTFTGREWGLGSEPESSFNPTNFNAEQIIGTLAHSGFKGAILTCKHHDGFCLWQTKTTEHSVKNSTWKNGKGDVVKEMSDACKKFGIKFGVYLSPWDRNSNLYGKPEYITLYRNQMRELLSQYGDIFEVWLDGANGGDGYYGGANEKREVDRTTYYDWDGTWSLIRRLQPNATIFSDIGPDIRWCGNESGYVKDSCWATYTPIGDDNQKPGIGCTQYKIGETGTKNGKFWMPAEVDVSIRPGWFFHKHENEKIKSSKQLVDIYLNSVGRGATLNLNIPPDTTGQINAHDVRILSDFQQYLTENFTDNLLKHAKVTASETRNNSQQFAATNVLLNNKKLYWTTNDNTTTAYLSFNFSRPETLNCIELSEYTPLGQRIQTFSIELREVDGWQEIYKGTTIGYKKIVVLKNDITSKEIRINFINSLACPIIQSVRMFKIKRM